MVRRSSWIPWVSRGRMPWVKNQDVAVLHPWRLIRLKVEAYQIVLHPIMKLGALLRHGPISHPAILAAKWFYEELPCSQIWGKPRRSEINAKIPENRGVLDSWAYCSWGVQQWHFSFFRSCDYKTLRPRKLTRNPEMEVWKMKFLFKWVIFNFHVQRMLG